MTTPFISLEQMATVYKIEQDWLFEKLLRTMNAHRHPLLMADQGWGIDEYVHELGFHLSEKYPDIKICKMDVKPAHSADSFLELFTAALFHVFPEVISFQELHSSSIDILRLPTLISKRKKIRVAVFLANSHLFHRFKNTIPFLRMLKLKFRNQKNCIFCLYGNKNPSFMDLVKYPGPLSGLGQLFELNHNPLNHRSASVRKLFHDNNKSIGYDTSVYMSYVIDDHPFYLRLLAWHALIRTRNTCTTAIVENALSDLIHHFDHHFHTIVETLTPKQISFLKALLEGNQKMYSKTTREMYQLGSTSNIARIKNSLEAKTFIHIGNGEIAFTDPVFREWLRRYYFKERKAQR